ncbi:monocarboxylate transporter 9-like [Amphibalanus amphitrite]|uniref:monocarboxylate transporter 9-like n=1 Tax=Amphibalanus amphitrite TaxID=1232801 RepID=UPI001C8FF68D|nr:monocarboxylate transporter 9-like [Amphibalanus amphitrite]
MPQQGEDVSLVEFAGSGSLAVPITSRRSSHGDIPVIKTPSDESVARAPSEPHLLPNGHRSRTASDASHPRTPRKASVASSFDERGSRASGLSHELHIPRIAVASADPVDEERLSVSQPKSKLDDDDDEIQVQDSYYSWVVAAGAALQFVLVGGIHKSFGLVLAALVHEYGFSSAEVAVIPALYFSFNFLASPLCGALCRRMSERTVCIMGGVGSLLGLALSGLTGNIYMLYVTNGMMFGVGQCFANIPGTLMVSKYFVKRRGLANSITAASAAIGGVFFPLMVQGMLEEYGIPGTYLMLGGIHMHTIISAMLYRPMETQREIMRMERRRQLRRCRKVSTAAGDDKELEKLETAPAAAKLLEVQHAERRHSEAHSEMEDGLLHPPLRHRHPDASLATSTSMLSQLNLAVEAPEAPKSSGCMQQVLRSLDLHLLTDPLYIACVTSVFLFMTGLPHVCLLIPRFGQEIDVSQADIARMIAMIAPIDIVSRLSLGFLLDRNLFHKRYGLFITCLVGGTGVLALVFVRSYIELFVACSIVYAAIGFYFVVTPVMYAEYYGVERLSSTLTMSNLFAGVANLTAQPLGGLLRDAAGTFRTVFAVLSGCMLAGGALVLLHPCIARRSAGRRNKQAETDAA